MNQLESRPLRYFVAVAQELNFTRAAQRLGIAAPPLSRAIARLEAQLGVTLLHRSTRRVELTDAGSVLLAQAQIALDALDAAARRAQRAAEPQRRLVLALKADLDGGLLDQITQAYRREQPAVPLEVLLCGWGEQPQLLRDGRADIAFMYEPHERFDDSELDFETLLEEPMLLALPTGHPLASRQDLCLADLESGYRRTARSHLWQPRHQGPERPRIGDMSQLLKLIELDRLVALLPTSVTARFLRPQIAYRPVHDAPPAVLTVAWPRSSRSPAAAAFVRVAADLAAEGASMDRRAAGTPLPA